MFSLRLSLRSFCATEAMWEDRVRSGWIRAPSPPVYVRKQTIRGSGLWQWLESCVDCKPYRQHNHFLLVVHGLLSILGGVLSAPRLSSLYLVIAGRVFDACGDVCCNVRGLVPLPTRLTRLHFPFLLSLSLLFVSFPLPACSEFSWPSVVSCHLKLFCSSNISTVFVLPSGLNISPSLSPSLPA